MKKQIVLFDGDCEMCRACVRFALRYRSKKEAEYLTLQSSEASVILKKHGLSETDFYSVLLFEGNKWYDKSTAVLRIVQTLRAPVSWLYLMVLVPKFIRDRIYDSIARRRHCRVQPNNVS